MNDEQRKRLVDEAADQIQKEHLDHIRDAIADAIDGAVEEILQSAEMKDAARTALKQVRATIGNWGTASNPNMGSANGAIFKEAVLNYLNVRIKELE